MLTCRLGWVSSQAGGAGAYGRKDHQAVGSGACPRRPGAAAVVAVGGVPAAARCDRNECSQASGIHATRVTRQVPLLMSAAWASEPAALLPVVNLA
jgi:hypothetical protein